MDSAIAAFLTTNPNKGRRKQPRTKKRADLRPQGTHPKRYAQFPSAYSHYHKPVLPLRHGNTLLVTGPSELIFANWQ